MLKIRHEVSLRQLNTFRLDVRAACFSEITAISDLYDLPADPEPPLFILGGGSNILFLGDPERWVLHNQLKGISVDREDEHFVWLRAASGEVWHDFVMHCLDQNLSGIENLSLIPGTVGAAPIQNIGAYGVEVCELIESVEYFELASKTLHRLSNADCRFGYRESIFKHELKGQVFITAVVFRLRRHPSLRLEYGAIRAELANMGRLDQPSVHDVAQAVIRIRSSKLPDPQVVGNGGSFFKNPEISEAEFRRLRQEYPDLPGYPVALDRVKVPAAWLIEKAGWKGYRRNHFGVHHAQALVLVNYSDAKGGDIYALSEEIIQSVSEQFRIQLEREVNIL